MSLTLLLTTLIAAAALAGVSAAAPGETFAGHQAVCGLGTTANLSDGPHDAATHEGAHGGGQHTAGLPSPPPSTAPARHHVPSTAGGTTSIKIADDKTMTSSKTTADKTTAFTRAAPPAPAPPHTRRETYAVWARVRVWPPRTPRPRPRPPPRLQPPRSTPVCVRHAFHPPHLCPLLTAPAAVVDTIQHTAAGLPLPPPVITPAPHRVSPAAGDTTSIKIADADKTTSSYKTTDKIKLTFTHALWRPPPQVGTKITTKAATTTDSRVRLAASRPGYPAEMNHLFGAWPRPIPSTRVVLAAQGVDAAKDAAKTTEPEIIELSLSTPTIDTKYVADTGAAATGDRILAPSPDIRPRRAIRAPQHHHTSHKTIPPEDSVTTTKTRPRTRSSAAPRCSHSARDDDDAEEEVSLVRNFVQY